jgi:hypothetical protein
MVQKYYKIFIVLSYYKEDQDEIICELGECIYKKKDLKSENDCILWIVKNITKYPEGTEFTFMPIYIIEGDVTTKNRRVQQLSQNQAYSQQQIPFM